MLTPPLMPCPNPSSPFGRRRKTVRAHNKTVLRWLIDNGHLAGPAYEVLMAHNVPAGDASPAERAAQAFLKEDPDFHELTSVAVGARVIWFQTDDKATGATNSKLGEVVEIVWGDPPEAMALPPSTKWVRALRVRLQGTGAVVTVDRSRAAHGYPYGQTLRKSTFPIMLAYAMTAHRAQVSARG